MVEPIVGLLLATLWSPAASLPVPVGLGAAIQARADSVTAHIRSSTWMQLTLDIDYSHRSIADSATLTIRWYKKNGSTLPFTTSATRVGPGTGRIALDAHYQGVLGPPVLIRMRALLQGRGGRVLARQECALVLVTAQGKTAWAGDLAPGRRGGLRWRARRCVAG